MRMSNTGVVFQPQCFRDAGLRHFFRPMRWTQLELELESKWVSVSPTGPARLRPFSSANGALSGLLALTKWIFGWVNICRATEGGLGIWRIQGDLVQQVVGAGW